MFWNNLFMSTVFLREGPQNKVRSHKNRGVGAKEGGIIAFARFKERKNPAGRQIQQRIYNKLPYKSHPECREPTFGMRKRTEIAI
jgi:hypothetical protein